MEEDVGRRSPRRPPPWYLSTFSIGVVLLLGAVACVVGVVMSNNRGSHTHHNSTPIPSPPAPTPSVPTVVHTWAALQKGVSSCEHACAFELGDGFTCAAAGFRAITIGSTQKVSIDGGGYAQIDAHGKARMFLVYGSLMVTNMVMQNGNHTSGTGGAVLVNKNGTATFENCRFVRNTAAIAGGAVALDGPATLKNCTFVENVAQVIWGRRQGGALWSSVSGAAILVDCSFIAGGDTSMGFNDIGHCTPSVCRGKSGAVTFSCPEGTTGGPARMADMTQDQQDYLLVTQLPPQRQVVQCLVLVLVSTWAELAKAIASASCEHACAFELADGFTSAAERFDLIDFQHKSVTIVGQGQIIDGHHKAQLFKVHNGSLVVDGVTMQNGAKGQAPGSGLELSAGSSVRLTNCVFKNNRNHDQWFNNYGGGAVMLYNSAVTFVNCTFVPSTNTSENGVNYNDVGHHDGTGSPSHVQFVCPDNTLGAPFTMAAADLLVTQLPPQQQLVQCKPKAAVADCNGSSLTLAANDCSAWQWFTRDPLYMKWAEGKCGPKVHTDPCSCTFADKVRCMNGHITKLNMASQGMPPSGGVPEALTYLTALTSLCLNGNQLAGSIPATISKLAELMTLVLGSNRFIGPVPQELVQLKKLNHLSIDNNPKLWGELPKLNFSQFTDCCDMADDVFTCPLPPGAKLSCVGGPGCGAGHHAPPPTCILPCNGSSSALVASDCSAWQRFTRNSLYTSWIEGVCDKNVHTDPCSCNIHTHGNVKCDGASTNKRIVRVDLGGRKMPPSGGMPTALLDLTGLTIVRLGENKLLGTIPTAIGQLTALVELVLSNNGLSGTVPKEMLQLAQLRDLNLANNSNLTGPLPAFDFAHFTNRCAMSGDPFTCPLPAGAEKCVGGPEGGRLPPPTCVPCDGTSFSLNDSDCSAWQRFTRDPLYKKWAEGKCGGQKVHTDPCSCTFHGKVQCYRRHVKIAKSRITTLDFGKQGLPPSGGVPLSLLDLTGLNVFIVSNNDLHGSIPSTIEQLTSLRYMDMSNNNLSGSIPSSIAKLTALTTLDLSYNKLGGSIPSTIGKLTGLTSLWIPCNTLAGSIPSTIGQLTGLTALDGWQNDFTGSIPTELAQLKQLKWFALNYNTHLTGKLPALNFSQFTRCCALDGEVFTCPLPPGASTSCVGGTSCGKKKPPTCK
jgi:Leucine-rich repeat (LRR) protein